VAERARGLAIVMASHEPVLVERVATRVVRLGDRAEVLADE
jgi:ABC-2 type transport system ATP-binding protein